jgi:hypothetical protein
MQEGIFKKGMEMNNNVINMKGDFMLQDTCNN